MDCPEGSGHLNDVILMAVLSLGAFGIGGFVSGLAASLAGPPVSALSVFQFQAGVPAATNSLDTDTEILGSIRDRIAAEYVSSSASADSGTRTNDPILARLQAAASTMVQQEAQAQVALSDATERADTARSNQLSSRRWKEVLIRIAASAASYLLLAGITAAVAAWAKVPVSWGLVLGCAAMLLLAFLVADIATWVAGLVLLLLIITFVIRDRSGKVSGV